MSERNTSGVTWSQRLGLLFEVIASVNSVLGVICGVVGLLLLQIRDTTTPGQEIVAFSILGFVMLLAVTAEGVQTRRFAMKTLKIRELNSELAEAQAKIERLEADQERVKMVEKALGAFATMLECTERKDRMTRRRVNTLLGLVRGFSEMCGGFLHGDGQECDEDGNQFCFSDFGVEIANIEQKITDRGTDESEDSIRAKDLEVYWTMVTPYVASAISPQRRLSEGANVTDLVRAVWGLCDHASELLEIPGNLGSMSANDIDVALMDARDAIDGVAPRV